MATSRSTEPCECKRKHQRREIATLARPLAPEEIRRGQFVTVLDEIHEWPSFFWCADESTLPREQTVRMRYLPPTGGRPLRVKRVCLPFVLVKQPDRKERAIDVRKCRLAELGAKYAKAAWQSFKKSPVDAPSIC